MNALEMKTNRNDSPRPTFDVLPIATIVDNQTEKNCRVLKRIPVQWNDLDADWKEVVIKHPCTPGQIKRLRRMWRTVISTLRS